MSIFEILVILIVSMLIIKPEDVNCLISSINKTRIFITDIHNRVLHYLNQEETRQNYYQSSENLTDDKIEQINFYLRKIGELNDQYTGVYSLEKVKEHYHSLVNQLIQSKKLKEKR